MCLYLYLLIDIDINISEALCYTPETTKTLQINCTSIKKLFVLKKKCTPELVASSEDGGMLLTQLNRTPASILLPPPLSPAYLFASALPWELPILLLLLHSFFSRLFSQIHMPRPIIALRWTNVAEVTLFVFGQFLKLSFVWILLFLGFLKRWIRIRFY